MIIVPPPIWPSQLRGLPAWALRTLLAWYALMLAIALAATLDLLLFDARHVVLLVDALIGPPS